MKIHTESFIRELLGPGVERRDLEFKAPFTWEKQGPQWLKERTIRAVLALHNTPSGGVILIGVIGHDDRPPDVPGVSARELKSFSNEEAVLAEICGYSTEQITLTIGTGVYRESEVTKSDVVVFEVVGLDELPTICTKAGKEKGTLAPSAIYSRPKLGVPASAPVTPHELEEIVRHGVERRVRWINSLGPLTLDDAGQGREAAARQDFSNEIGELWQD